jgi:hypothetical protein
MTASNGTHFGLLVDDLGESVEVLAERLTPLPPMVTHEHMFADCALATGSADDGSLVVVLRADRLHGNIAATAGHGAGNAAAARSAA